MGGEPASSEEVGLLMPRFPPEDGEGKEGTSAAAPRVATDCRDCATFVSFLVLIDTGAEPCISKALEKFGSPRFMQIAKNN